MVDGRRLYSLVGPDGLMVAYLDVPPGLDIEPLLTHRVGVRGVTHYNEDLGATDHGPGRGTDRDQTVKGGGRAVTCRPDGRGLRAYPLESRRSPWIATCATARPRPG